MKKENMTAFDEKLISLYIWDEVEKPKAVLQLIHGMAEHMLRYDDFAKYLNSNGIIVIADDHRAHGETDRDNLGRGNGGNIFEDSLRDEKQITALVKERYKGLPLVILGHSYGSFLTQRYLMDSPEIDGCILSGSALMSGFIVNLGYSISKSKCKKGKGKDSGDMFAKMTFKSYDKKFREGLNAWLSRDAREVGKYNIDSLCGFTCSNEFYRDFFAGLKKIAKEPNNVSKELKMLIISGAKDMVGGCGKLVEKLHEKYVALGLTPELKLYDGARHELINEINRDEVFADIAHFISQCGSV